jgi:hypothetical protein
MIEPIVIALLPVVAGMVAVRLIVATCHAR